MVSRPVPDSMLRSIKSNTRGSKNSQLGQETLPRVPAALPIDSYSSFGSSLVDKKKYSGPIFNNKRASNSSQVSR